MTGRSRLATLLLGPSLLALLFLGSGLLAACGPPSSPVRFAPVDIESYGHWHRSEYARIHRRWTRYQHLTKDFTTTLDVHATLLSDEFRAAYLAEVTALRRFTPTQHAALAKELRGAGDRWVEVVIEMVTSNWRWNDLTSPRSVWTLTLVDDAGHVAEVAEVASVQEKPDTLQALFPPVTPFTRGWRVRFPRILSDGTLLLGPHTRALTLRFAGPLGSAEVRWEGRP